MKKIIVILLILLVISGCSVNNSTENNNDQIVVNLTPKPTETEKTTVVPEPTEKIVLTPEAQEYVPFEKETTDLTKTEIEYAKKVALPIYDNLIKWGGAYLHKLDTTEMILTMYQYEDHPYYDMFEFVFIDGLLEIEKFNTYGLKKMGYELFNDENIYLNARIMNEIFNDKTGLYEANVDLGINQSYDYKNMNIYSINNNIIVEFDLYDSEGATGPGEFPNDKGKYVFNFKIMKDVNEKIFLRFTSTEKIES